MSLSAFAGCLGGDEGADDGAVEPGAGDGTAGLTGARAVLADCLAEAEFGGAEEGEAEGIVEEEAEDVGEADGEAITFGTILPITGNLQAFGPAMQKATELAANQINEAGGILDGRPIELEHEDSQTSPEVAPQAFSRLVNQFDVPVVVGAASSGVTSTLMNLADENDVVLLTPASTSPALTAERAGGFFFRIPPSDALQGDVMAMILDECGIAENVNTLAVNNDYGKGFVAVMSEEVDVNEEVFYSDTATTFDSEVARVCGGEPSAIVFVGYPGEGSQIMTTAFEQGCLDEVPWLFSEGVFDPAFIEQSGFAEEGQSVLAGYGGTAPQALAQVIVGEELTGAGDFAERYAEAYGEAPGLFTAESYDAVILAALAAEIAGSAEGEAIRDALPQLKDGEGARVNDVAVALKLIREGQDIDWIGPSGDFEWDIEHSPRTGTYAIWLIGEDGSLTLAERGIQAGAVEEGEAIEDENPEVETGGEA